MLMKPAVRDLWYTVKANLIHLIHGGGISDDERYKMGFNISITVVYVQWVGFDQRADMGGETYKHNLGGVDMTKLDNLKALLDTFETAEHLYQQQSAAYEFTAYGRDLLRVVEAAKVAVSSGKINDMYLLQDTISELEEDV